MSIPTSCMARSAGYDGRPTDYQLARIDVLEGELGAINARYAEVEAKHLGKINEGLRKAGLPEITWPPQGGMPDGRCVECGWRRRRHFPTQALLPAPAVGSAPLALSH
ncbi:MAG: hypothetical protein IPO08_15400 [Xanthomonadales bacterium]|nr:hypothetical protein [Xanthomonadales bacterium]